MESEKVSGLTARVVETARRMAGLRHRVASDDGAYRDPIDALQAAGPPPVAVDAGAVLPGPPLDHALGVVAGEIPLGEHPPDDFADAMAGLPMERPATHVPVHPEKSGGLVGESPVLVSKVVLQHKPVIRATRAVNNTKLVLNMK